MGGWAGPRTNMNVVENRKMLCPAGIRTPNRLARILVSRANSHKAVTGSVYGIYTCQLLSSNTFFISPHYKVSWSPTTLWLNVCQLKTPNISVWIMSWQLSQKVLVDISMPPRAMRGTRATCWCRQWSIGCTCYSWRRQLFKYGRRPTFANDHDWLKISWSQASTYHTETSKKGTNYHQSIRNYHYTTRITVCSHFPVRFQCDIY